MRIAKIVVDGHDPIVVEIPDVTYEGLAGKNSYFHAGQWSFSVYDDGDPEHVKSSIGSYIAWHLVLEGMERP
jgi:hypothetical protein